MFQTVIAARPIRSDIVSTAAALKPDLLPWCEHHGMPAMAYTPLGDRLVRDPSLIRMGAAHNCSASAVALAWTVRSGNVIAIPESGSPVHVRENAAALSLTLTQREIETLSAAHPIRARICAHYSIVADDGCAICRLGSFCASLAARLMLAPFGCAGSNSGRTFQNRLRIDRNASPPGRRGRCKNSAAPIRREANLSGSAQRNDLFRRIR